MQELAEMIKYAEQYQEINLIMTVMKLLKTRTDFCGNMNPSLSFFPVQNVCYSEMALPQPA